MTRTPRLDPRLTTGTLLVALLVGALCWRLAGGSEPHAGLRGAAGDRRTTLAKVSDEVQGNGGAPASRGSTGDERGPSPAAAELGPGRPAGPLETRDEAATPPTEYVLWGVLLGPAGATLSVPGGSLDFYDDRGGRLHGELEDAVFTAAGLHPGRWWWHFRGPGVRPARGQLELTGSQAARRLDLTLEPLPRVAVAVSTPAGEGWMDLLARSPAQLLPRLDIVVTRAPLAPHTIVQLDELEQLGRQLHRLGPSRRHFEQTPPEVLAEFTMLAEPPLQVSLTLSEWVLACAPWTAGSSRVEFVLDPEELIRARGGIRGSVVARVDGAPLEGAQLELHSGLGRRELTTSEASGDFELTDLTPGTWRLQVTRRGFATLVLDVDVVPGEPGVLGELLLEPPAGLRLGLYAGDEQAVLLNLWVRKLDGPGEVPVPWLELSMFEPGVLLEEGLGAGRYRLEPAPALPGMAPWTFRPRVVELHAGSPLELELEVVRGARLTLLPGEDGGSFALLPAAGPAAELPVWEGPLTPHQPLTRYFAPGPWRLELRDAQDAAPSSRRLSLPPEGLSLQVGER